MLKKLFQKEELAKLIKFGAVGVLNTAVDYAVFTLTGFISPNIYLAQTLGYSAGVLNSYALNRKWTFKSGDKFLSTAFLRFVLVNVLTYLASMVALWLFADKWGINKYIAKIFLVGVTFVLNFIFSRIWVFKEKEKPDIGEEKSS